MKVHELDRATIYEGEALSVLASLSSAMVDAVVTDPPYCSGAFTLAGKQRPPNEKYSKLGGGVDIPSFLVMRATSAVLRCGLRSGWANACA